MKKLWIGLLVAGLAAGCSNTGTQPTDDQGGPTGGKADEFETEQESCEATGGTWTDDASDAYYCLCAADQTFVSTDGCTPRDEVRSICELTGGTFEEGSDWAYCSCPGGRDIDHGNCLAPDPAEEALCLDSGGTWTDDASDSYYCICEDGADWVPDAGCASNDEIASICGATGGTFFSGADYAYCQCGDRIAEHGNCLASDPAEEAACNQSGGLWTDDASDSYYCVCPAGQVPATDEGCVDPSVIQGRCEATGGTFEEGDGWASCTCYDGRNVDHGNCLAASPAAEHACGVSGGTWTDDASDSYYCICPDDSEIYDGTPCPE